MSDYSNHRARAENSRNSRYYGRSEDFNEYWNNLIKESGILQTSRCESLDEYDKRMRKQMDDQ